MTAKPDEQNAHGVVMHVTEFPHLAESRAWQYARATWQQFADGMRQRGTPEQADKKDGALWAPIKLRQGQPRANANVLEVSALTIDVDHADEATVLDVFKRLDRDGLAYVAHTTHSHNPIADDWRLRFVVPLAEPVMGRSWPPLWRAAIARYAPAADQACKDVARQYYYPARPVMSDADRYFVVVQDGAPLVPSSLGSVEAVAPIENHRVVSRDALTTLAGRWKRAKDPKKADLGIRLAKAMQGEAFAQSGERDSIMFAMCGAIVEDFPDCSPQSIAEAFALSLGRMALDSDGAPTAEQVADKIERCKRYRQEREQSRAAEKQGKREAHCVLAGHPEPYSAQEIEQYAKTLGVGIETLEHCWIIQHQSDYYVLSPGPTYQLAKRESLVNNAKTSLAPAPVRLWDDDGALVSHNTLLERNSIAVQNVVRSLVAQRPSVDIARSTLTLPTCPRRDLSPQYSDRVNEWLEILGGNDSRALKDWLALCLDLEQPLSALTLIGWGGGGKSLMAAGLARLWSTEGATSIDDAMGAFNDPLERCPLVFADEKLPRDFRGQVRTEDLRRFIQETKRQSNRKNRAQCPLIGAIRLVIAANNENLLDLRGQLSMADVQAIGERFFHIEVTKEAKQYLDSVGRETIESEWLQGDELPCHVRWLAANERPRWAGRFGVAHDSSGVANRIAVRTGIRASICEWLVRCLEDDARKLRDGSKAGIANGSIVLHVSTLTESWDYYLRNEPRPKTSQVATALEGLTLEKIRYDDRDLHVIDVAKVKAWADEHGYVAPEWIDKRIRELGE